MNSLDGAVLLTGASGAIGSPAMKALLARGARQLILAGRDAVDLPASSQTDVRWLRIDLGDDHLVLPAGLDVVVHAAGEKRDTANMQRVNHHGARKLAEAASRAGVRRFVHVSSVGVYGAGHRAGVVDEATTHHPANPYEVSKDDGEAAVRDVCATASMECVVLQPSNVVAPAGAARPLLRFLSAIRRGRFVRFDQDDAWLNYVAVDDVAAAVAHVALGPAISGTFIVNTPERLGDVLAWAAESLHVQPPVRRWPEWLGNVACHMGALAGHLLQRRAPFDRERLRELTGTTRFDAAALHRATGFYYPQGVKAMLAALVQRYEREGKL